jgi:hypothetical protein
MCKKDDCPIYETCDKEHDQALYCRRVELLVHLSKTGKGVRRRRTYVSWPVQPVVM